MYTQRFEFMYTPFIDKYNEYITAHSTGGVCTMSTSQIDKLEIIQLLNIVTILKSVTALDNLHKYNTESSFLEYMYTCVADLQYSATASNVI